MVLLTAVQALMHRYTGQDDIVVGTASANRGRNELAPLIGFLVNTLPIRSDLSGNPTFEELLAQVRETAVAAYAHQDLPFAKLVEMLRVERDPSRAPIFQVGLTFAEAPQPIQLTGVRLELQVVKLLVAKFDLDFFVEARDGQLELQVFYPPALYDPETVQRMLGHFGMLLEGAVADPTQRISDLPLLTDAELYASCMAGTTPPPTSRSPASTSGSSRPHNGTRTASPASCSPPRGSGSGPAMPS